MFDQGKADRAIQFFKEYLHHTNGRWAGKPFQLLPWEEDLIRKMYGTVRPDGKRQYRKVFVFIPKKNGKSEIAAGVALYGLLADGENSAEVYCSAGDREQASIVFNTAVKMINYSKPMRKRTKIRESTKRILVPKTSSYWKVLSSESKTKHGLNISTSVIDELHVVTREQYEVLTQGVGDAREQPLIFIVTTAGNDKKSVCFEEYLYAKKVRDGVIQDETYLPVIYEVPDTEDWTKESTWRAANPSLGFTIDIENFRQAYKEARELPTREAIFRQLRLNQWVSNVSRWLQIAHWEKCFKEMKLDNFIWKPCYCGLDLSSTTDLTAFAAVFKEIIEGIPFYFGFVHFWCPAENILDRSKKDKVPYQMWAKQGWITATEGNVIDYDDIKQYIIEFKKRFDVRQINVDRWNSTQLVNDLQKDGIDMTAFGQGFRSMSGPSKEFEILILSERMKQDGNPVMRWMIDNVIVERDAAENIKPSKHKSVDRIDGIVAEIMALDGWIRNAKPESVYEKDGVKTI